MYPVVVIRQPGHTPIHLQVREAIEVGRECTGVLLADPRVSRRHLVLAPTFDGGADQVAVLDLGSMNGTRLDGVRLTTEVVMHPGQKIELGETTIALALDTDPPAESGPDDPATTVMPVTRFPADG